MEKGYNDIAAGRVQNATERSQNSWRIIDVKYYTVEITNEALDDMEQLYNHIADVLQVPENAMDQYNRIADAILTLDTMAERISIMESEPERSKEMRRLLVDNYSVFFASIILEYYSNTIYSLQSFLLHKRRISHIIKHAIIFV